MGTYRPKVGDRVRVVLEGVVGSSGDRWFDVGNNCIRSTDEHVVSVERLPDPEPEWWPPQPGDVVRYVDSTYLRGFNAEWTNASGHRATDDNFLAAHRERDGLALLIVRDGKPVSNARP